MVAKHRVALLELCLNIKRACAQSVWVVIESFDTCVRLIFYQVPYTVVLHLSI